MYRLRDQFRGECAVIVFGGPSILETRLDLSRLDRDKYVIFLESKALTPYFLRFGIEPHFFLMLYPEKCKANSFQSVVFQSFLADVDVRPLIREEWHPELDYMKEHFDEYFEVWKPELPHKRYRWKPDVYLRNSPFDLLPKLKQTLLVTYVVPFRHYVRRLAFDNPIYVYDHTSAEGSFSLEDYYRPVVADGCLKVKDPGFTNSAAIAMCPLLKYLGFAKVCFIGMDMSMLGSMEYSSLYTFRCLRSFGFFFERARPVFSGLFPRRAETAGLLAKLWQRSGLAGVTDRVVPVTWRLPREEQLDFRRPWYEFEVLKLVLSYDRIEFINVFEPFKYAYPLPGIRNVTFEEFLNE